MKYKKTEQIVTFTTLEQKEKRKEKEKIKRMGKGVSRGWKEERKHNHKIMYLYTCHIQHNTNNKSFLNFIDICSSLIVIVFFYYIT